jgi:hypothetical protein
MRLFQFDPDEVVGTEVLTITIDLDTIVMCQETPYEGRVLRNVYLSNGYNIALTKAGFDRVMAAWKST